MKLTQWIVFALLLSGVAKAQPPYFPNGAPSITAVPPGPWAPGTVVTFTITIDDYEASPNGISEWFHGLGIVPGSCWTNLTYGTPPPAYTNGNWIVDLNPLPPKTGGLAIPGFYFDGTAGSTSGFIDGITSNNWGDGSGSGPWTFTWTATVPANQPNPCDLSMGVQVFGDGQTGSWTQLPPGLQPIILYNVTIPLYCTDQVITVPTTAGVQNPIWSYSWDIAGANLLSGNLNSFGPLNISFSSPDTVYVTRTATEAGNVVQIDSFLLYIIQQPNPSFTISRSAICQDDTVTIIYTGDTSASYTYSWNFLGGTIVSGSGAGPYVVHYPSPLQDNLSVVVSNAACASDTFKVPFVVKPVPTSSFSMTSNLCTTDTVLVTYDGVVQPGMSFNWNFGNGIVISGNNEGPYQVTWLNPVQDSIQLTVSLNGCEATTVDSFTISVKPIVDAGQNFNICEGAPCVTLNASLIQGTACTYQWTPAIGLDDPNSLNPCASPSVTTTYYLVATCGGCPSLADSMTVVVKPKPVASISADTVTICKGNSAILPGSASGGTGNLGIQWYPTNGISSPFIETPTINPTTSGFYYLFVTDSQGCISDTDSVYVNLIDLTIANAGSDQTICPNSLGIQLNGTVQNPMPGDVYTYSWSPATGLSDPTSPDPFANPDSTTVYTLTVTSQLTGCSSLSTTLDTLATVTVTVLPELYANAGVDKTICEGQGTMIGDLPQGGGPDYTYQWSPATGLSDPSVRNPIANPLTTTVYTLVVFSNGCESVQDEVTVAVINQPTESNLTDIDLCPGDSLQLFPNINAGSLNYSVRWFPSDGISDTTSLNPIVRPEVTTAYNLFVRIDSCEFLTKQFTVTVLDTPTVNATTIDGLKEIIICQGDSVQLTTGINGNFASFTWSQAFGLSDPNSNNPYAFPLETTIYYLQVSTGTCSILDSVIVAVAPPLIAEASADTIEICQGQEISLSAEGGLGSATFIWTIDGQVLGTGQNLNLTLQDSATIVLFVKEGTCYDYDTVIVNVNQQPTNNVTPSTFIGCAELTVSFMDNSFHANAWEWDFGDGNTSNLQNPVHVYDTPGNYTVQFVAVGTGGCRDTKFLNIFVAPPAEANFFTSPDYVTSNPIYLPDAIVSFLDSSQNAVAWNWDFGDGNISNLQNPVHEYLSPGEYMVTLIVQDAGACLDTITKGPIVIEEPTFVLPNVFTPNGDGVNDELRLNYKGRESFNFQVYDRYGVQLFETNNPSEGWKGVTKSGKPAVEGVYFYLIQIGKKKITGNVTLLR